MTAVVGLVHEGRTHLAGDSAATAGYSTSLRAQPKVFRKGSYLLGVAGSVRVLDVVRHCLLLPEPDEKDLDRFMVTTFIDSLRETLKEAGVSTRTSEAEYTNNSYLLVGVQGRLFEIASDYQVHEPLDGYAAIGAGYEPALGVLYALPKAPPARRLRTAMEAAERYNATVRAPFAFISERTSSKRDNENE